MAFVRVPGNDIPEGAEEHWLEGRGGVKMRVLTAPSTNGPPRGSVIVAPGRTEFIEKYFEVLRELQARGFAVFCIDWRGQGLSGRETSNPLKGHFASFDDPVNDLATALRLLAHKLPRPHHRCSRIRWAERSCCAPCRPGGWKSTPPFSPRRCGASPIWARWPRNMCAS